MRWESDLTKDIRFHDHRDDMDGGVAETAKFPYNGVEFSECNRNQLKKVVQDLGDSCKNILEIGIARSEQGSSYVILNNKPTDCNYLGVDIRDGSFLSGFDNAHTLQTPSENFEIVKSKLKELKMDSLDFIFIDGWHSINQVLKEWEYTSLLSDGGVVGFHDTNNHPGPVRFVENLNDSWVVNRFCTENDNGISFVFKK